MITMATRAPRPDQSGAGITNPLRRPPLVAGACISDGPNEQVAASSRSHRRAVNQQDSSDIRMVLRTHFEKIN